jgi:hypothetical protein
MRGRGGVEEEEEKEVIQHEHHAHLELAVPPAVLQQLRVQVLDLGFKLLHLRLTQRLQLVLHCLKLVLDDDGCGGVRGMRGGCAVLRAIHGCGATRSGMLQVRTELDFKRGKVLRQVLVGGRMVGWWWGRGCCKGGGGGEECSGWRSSCGWQASLLGRKNFSRDVFEFFNHLCVLKQLR